MASFFRLMLWMTLLIGLLGLLSIDLTFNAEMTYAGILLILLAYLMFSGGEPIPKSQKSAPESRVNAEEDEDLPDPIEPEKPIKRTLSLIHI